MKPIHLLTLALMLMSTKIHSQVKDPVKWNFKYENQKNGSVSIIAEAKIEDDWHLYGTQIPEGGPIPTTLTLEAASFFKVKGNVLEVPKPELKYDSNFGLDISLHNKKASFIQNIEPNQTEGFKVKGSVEYMCCNDETCLPPKTVTFELDVIPNVTKSDITKTVDRTEVTTQEIDLGQDTTGMSMVSSDSVSMPTTSTTTSELSSGKEQENESMAGFFLLALLAGLLGTLTPCVFPMIPMTVSFFLRGSGNRASAIGKGLFFGLSITAIYTLVGVLVSLTSVGGGFANALSTHWIPNLLFFILFAVFAASFFGLFEIVLPSGMVNKADQQADKGGLVGVFFMALALVLVSFSCTGPIVGALLVEAAGGIAMKPILGMFGFGLAFAVPFTLFAIFPSWLGNLPKSGGWLNSVKIVLGFVILAFSFKYLSVVDQTYHLGLLSRDVFLSIWIVLSILLGLYFLGKIRFSHDSPVESVSFGRFLMASASFVFAFYLFTGLLGAPLKDMGSMLPPQENSNKAMIQNPVASPSTLCSKPKYSDILHLPHGLQGYFDYEEGYACARKLNKPVFIDVKGHACSNCKKMENTVWSQPEVMKRLREDFVIIALYVDDRTKLPESEWQTSQDGKSILKTIGQVNADLQVKLFKTNTQPYYTITDTDGNPLVSPKGLETDVKEFVKWLDEGKLKFNELNK